MHNRGGYQSNKRGGTRGKVDRGHSDAGGVALKAWREQLGRAEVDAVRHCRCRRGGRRHHSTGSPFGHHPRLSIVCPLRGQWVSTWSILRGLSSVHHEMSMYYL